MLGTQFLRSKFLTMAVLGSFLLMMMSLGATPARAQSVGQLVGFIYADDLKTPVADAVVELKNIQDGSIVMSSPTDTSGLYKIAGIMPGRYIIGVKVRESGFNCEYIISIMAGETGKLSLALKPGKKADIERPIYETSSGLAEKLANKKPFFLTPAGIAVIVVAASGAGYGIVHLTKAEVEEASPSKK